MPSKESQPSTWFAPPSRRMEDRLLYREAQLHPFVRVILHWAIDFVGARLEIDVKHLSFVRRDSSEELLLDSFAHDLEVVLLLAGIAHDKRGLSRPELLRHVDLMLD